MSAGDRIPLAQARALADEVVVLLCVAAVRTEIAGSIRRGKPDIGDIEIVLQAGRQSGDPLDQRIADLRRAGTITPVLNANGKDEAWGDRHKRGFYRGVRLDLFIVRPDRQWGVTYLLRTGPGDANEYLVTRRKPDGSGYGGCPPHLLFFEGSLYRLAYPLEGRPKKLPPGAQRLDLPEETDVFAALAMPYIDPADRTVSTYKRLYGARPPDLEPLPAFTLSPEPSAVMLPGLFAGTPALTPSAAAEMTHLPDWRTPPDAAAWAVQIDRLRRAELATWQRVAAEYAQEGLAAAQKLAQFEQETQEHLDTMRQRGVSENTIRKMEEESHTERDRLKTEIRYAAHALRDADRHAEQLGITLKTMEGT